jgi:hypothetical protein
MITVRPATERGVLHGEYNVNGISLGSGDAAKITGESAIVLDRGDAAEVLLFDLP